MNDKERSAEATALLRRFSIIYSGGLLRQRTPHDFASHTTNESLYIVIKVIILQYVVYFHANRPLCPPTDCPEPEAGDCEAYSFKQN